MPRSARKTAWGCARVSRRANDRGGNPLGCAYGIRGPPRYGRRKSPFHRRARACPSPCLELHGKRPGLACGFRAGRTIAGGNPLGCADGIRGPPRYEKKTILEPSRGTGPRATMKKNASLSRRARACPSPCLELHGKRPGAARGFRAGRTIAGETLSDARMASEGPRTTGKNVS